MKIGDIITITDTGCIYPTYKDMAAQLGADFDKWKSNRMGSCHIRGKHAEILNINKHAYSTSACHVLIEMVEGPKFGEQYVIGMDGIKIDVVANILEDDLFDI